ncbi:MAG: hypothetical protein CTY12_06475 [Methylotenera sp.]|nr:MAG: hypothetical protein CTY12_06475 [Methylotenera sp.]
MGKRGRKLSPAEWQIYKPYFSPEVLHYTRIVDGHTPFWLWPSMCAVVLQQKIYFRAGYYQPSTLQGIALLGHELTHVEQFLQGMTIWHYLWECRHGYVKNRYEVAAYAKGAMISYDVAKRGII